MISCDILLVVPRNNFDTALSDFMVIWFKLTAERKRNPALEVVFVYITTGRLAGYTDLCLVVVHRAPLLSHCLCAVCSFLFFLKVHS